MKLIALSFIACTAAMGQEAPPAVHLFDKLDKPSFTALDRLKSLKLIAPLRIAGAVPREVCAVPLRNALAAGLPNSAMPVVKPQAVEPMRTGVGLRACQ